ncbi:hypothetical protein AMECASPLE_031969 [Ameca splendens]|uniref:Uncharacterized protein n=1 Tax=Ameca splendens TaxID=208324 RepID=A0ABV0XJF2_9TELE
MVRLLPPGTPLRDWPERNSAVMSLCWQKDKLFKLDPRVSYDHPSYALSLQKQTVPEKSPVETLSLQAE